MKSRFCLLSVQTVLEDKLKNAKKRNATTMKKRKEKKGKEKKQKLIVRIEDRTVERV